MRRARLDGARPGTMRAVERVLATLPLLASVAVAGASASVSASVSTLSPRLTTATIFQPSTGIAVAVSADGAYAVTARPPAPAWTFHGMIGYPLDSVTISPGVDRLGPYKEITFRYQVGATRTAAIRAYAARPVVLFRVTYPRGGRNTAPFPALTIDSRGLSFLSYSGVFGHYRFDPGGLGGAADSPRLLFDAHANTAILSPASNAMVAATTIAPALRASATRGVTGASAVTLSSGITSTIPALPAGLTQTTMLAIGAGINKTFDSWGRAMTDLQGKARSRNDADAVLARLGYWTDNAAAYYYNWEDSHRYSTRDPRDYTATLLAVRDEFRRIGAPLGYMQLDSWWYPKGPAADWGISGVIRHQGAYLYRAAQAVFPQGLRVFRRQLGLPLVAHARWIDPGSPYTREYRMSGGVSIDRRFWDDTLGYLRDAGVVTYEQDWLGDPAGAVAANTIHDQTVYMDEMAAAAGRRGLDLQYCMPSARHYLQSALYNNARTIRVSEDGFKDGLAIGGAVDDKWTPFLYDARLAGALGIWPFTDAVRSDSPSNLLLATLSGGPVGLADRLTAVERHEARARANLARVARTDGVIVKPDAPIAPIDAVYLRDAAEPGRPGPMVAATYTDHGGAMKAAYVFSYSRPRPDRATMATFTPAALGLGFGAHNRVYVYDDATRAGAVQEAGRTVTMRAPAYQGAYNIVVPVGPSGIALLGDTAKFVSLGKKRVRALRDDGRAVRATIAFAAGEGPVTLSGYAAATPYVAATYGAARLRYDPRTRLFGVVVTPGPNGVTATLSIGRRPGA